eukprot:jgi/Mesvir1/19070/Mv12827-RA.1
MTRSLKTKVAITVGSTTVLSLVAYQIYKSGVLKRAQKSVEDSVESLYKFCDTLSSLNGALSSTSRIAQTITDDLESYLRSDSGALPGSLRQLIKAAGHADTQELLVKLTSSVVKGACVGLDVNCAASSTPAGSCAAPPGIIDRIMDKLISKRGASFVSVIMTRVLREGINSYMDAQTRGRQDKREGGGGATATSGDIPQNQTVLDTILLYVGSDKGRQLVRECVTTFVVNLVSVYVDKTASINPYDEILTSVAKPAHRPVVRDLMATMCNEAVSSYVRVASGMAAERPHHHHHHHDCASAATPSSHVFGTTTPILSRIAIDASLAAPSTTAASTPASSFGSPPHLYTRDDCGGGGGEGPPSPCSFMTPVKPACRASHADSQDHPGQGAPVVPAHGPASLASWGHLCPPCGGGGGTVAAACSLDEPPGWIADLVRVARVPANRSLVCDVAGVVSAQAVRSLVAALAEMFRSRLRTSVFAGRFVSSPSPSSSGLGGTPYGGYRDGVGAVGSSGGAAMARPLVLSGDAEALLQRGLFALSWCLVLLMFSQMTPALLPAH